MPFLSNEGIRYYTFTGLDLLGVPHAALTRHGGVSTGQCASLNIGSTVGDDPAHVHENQRRAFAAFGFDRSHVYDVWQVHGVDFAIADAPRPVEHPHLKADIIFTTRRDVRLLMRFADCVPILLYDPEHEAAGIVHAGWQGTVKQAASIAVSTMQKLYGSRPHTLHAAIGPSIGPDHYIVGTDVVEHIQRSFGRYSASLLTPHNGSAFFDLWQANRLLLETAGVKNIEVAGICTACHTDDWFSHRHEKGKTGRFGVYISVRP